MTPLSLDQLEALVTEVTHHAWQSSWPARPACATPSCPSCLDQGIDLDVISRWLGHPSPVITRKTYTRLLASTEERAAQALESAVRAAKERRAEGFLWDERAIRAAAQAPQTTKTASDRR